MGRLVVRSSGWLVGGLVVWFVVRWFGLLFGCLVGWLVGRLVGRLVGWLDHLTVGESEWFSAELTKGGDLLNALKAHTRRLSFLVSQR